METDVCCAVQPSFSRYNHCHLAAEIEGNASAVANHAEIATLISISNMAQLGLIFSVFMIRK